MAAATTAPSPLHRYRTYAMVEVGRRVVLLYVFKSGTNKSDSEFLDKYLQALPASSTANYLKMTKAEKKLNKIEIDRINRDSTCDSFDTTLLYKTIRFACEHLKPCHDPAWVTQSDELEYCITAVKNCRNECNHGPHEINLLEYKKTYNDLRTLYHKTLDAAGKKYTLTSVEVDVKKQEVDSELRKIDREILGMDDLLSYYGPRLKLDLIAEADAQLRTNLEAAKSISPLSFLTGITLDLDIDDVFTEVKVTQGNRGENGTSVFPVKLNIERQPGDTNPKVLLVEGVAGSGKSTLVAKVITEWLENVDEPTIYGLQQYKLLLRVQCRDRGVKSMEGLLENVMPQVFGKFRGCLVPIFKECNVLFFIDGLDEANEDSTALISDILQCMNSVTDCALVITSRPEGIQTFERKIPTGYKKFYVNLKGIEEAQRKSFVERYHHHLQSKTGIVRNTTEFVQKVTPVLLQESFRLPLNMVFLTWVDLKSPDVITATMTQTQLYVSSYQLLFERLVDRVVPSSHQDVRTLKRNLEKCLEALQRECLLALWDLQLTLKEEAVDRIWTACDQQNVPARDVLSSFLSLRMSRSALGVLEEEYAVPHMGLQEFNAALCIKRHLSSTSRGIMTVLQDILQTADIQLPVFQNTFKHVAGLVHHIPDREVESLSNEVVDLLWESGMRQEDDWHDLVEETKAADPIIRRVAYHYPKYNHEEITDSRVFSYTALLPHLPPSSISINFNRDLEGQEAHIEDLIGALNNHRCVTLVLHHHFRHPVPSTPSYQLVKEMLLKADLETFTGYVKTEDLQLLFKNPLESLWLVVKGNDHARSLFPALAAAYKSRRKVDRITIHVPMAATTPHVEVTHDAVSPLNIKPRLTLILSGVGEAKLEEAVRVACAMCPKGKPYWGMRFPGATLGRDSWHRLIEGLAAGGVKVQDSVWVPLLKGIPREKKGRLNNLSKSVLGTGMGRRSEELLWRGKS